jgi:hypothetical protein
MAMVGRSRAVGGDDVGFEGRFEAAVGGRAGEVGSVATWCSDGPM